MRVAALRAIPGKHGLIAGAAVLGWLGLTVQLYLILLLRWSADASLLGGLVNFFSFFTVLSNTLVATVLTCALNLRISRGQQFLLQPWVSSGIAASILLVGLAYSLLLRHLWHPQGWQWLADELLHDVMPLLFLVYWWCCVPKGKLRLRHIGVWMLYPMLYFAYLLLRGRLLGLYPYPFIAVDKLGYPQVLLNALGILAGFVLVSLVLLGIDRWLGHRRPIP
ncbi:Pr6Pr family membrane protein [Pseudomonas sp. MAFF 302030]|uniref:Pr6Pr family membrane protein n=1 Tax=Pseudomonas morbosilactucae TaxID=2938197 RepID=A0A9X1YXY5_9PSED|nr:Pr6Pr family membrane protein [Pseudomonas morbosilactucae]MCK9800014.1 Pr6Pr family membrane protein [Pseudomonas morbosilactucae]